MSSINDRFDDPVWLENLKKKDPRAFVTDAYVIHGPRLKPEVACYFQLECKSGAKAGKGEKIKNVDKSGKVLYEGPLTLNWMFCYACNRMSHIKCQGLVPRDFVGHNIEKPWRCGDCQKEPHNESALAFFESNVMVNELMSVRRDHFLQQNVYEKVELLDDTDIENPDYQEKYEHQRAQFEELAKKYYQVVEEKGEVEKRLKGLETRMSNYDKLEERLSRFEEVQKELQVVKSQLNGKESLGTVRRSNIHSSSFISNPVLTVDDVLTGAYLPNNKYEPENASFVEYEAPLPTRRKSLIEDLNIDQLTVSEKIFLEQTQAQRETNEAQKEMTSTMSLAVIRKAIPAIAPFDGDPRKFLKFKQDVQRHKEIGKYSSLEVKLHILGALKGTALSRVGDLIDTTDLDSVMQILTKSFGDPSSVLEKCSSDILDIKIGKELFKCDVISINTKIQAYFSACKYAEVDCINSNQLAKHIFDQFSLSHKQLMRSKLRVEFPDKPTRLIDLHCLFSFLEDLSNDLEDKRLDDKKNDEKKQKFAQIHAFSSNSSGFSYKSVNESTNGVSEKNGYDMKSVSRLERFCDICSRPNHFPIQCNKFKVLNFSDKLACAKNKSLCLNCLLSRDHKAVDCSFRSFCGFDTNGVKCGRKHHICLHRALESVSENAYKAKGPFRKKSNSSRRSNTQNNQSRASNIYNQSQPSPSTPPSTENAHPNGNHVHNVINSAPTLSQVTGYGQRQTTVAQSTTGRAANELHNSFDFIQADRSRQQLSLGNSNIQATVKVFKNYFYGVNGYAIGWSMGDSGAEVSLLREDLREKLGLTGVKCRLPLQWTDGQIKVVDALMVDLEVQGVHENAQKILLRHVYAVSTDAMNLASRSLDMDKMRSLFPYLRDVPFEGYTNVSPPLLIGGPHASVIESDGRLLQGGEGKPVGLKSKLGWTVYGGCPESQGEFPFVVDSINTSDGMLMDDCEKVSNEKLLDMYVYFCSIESLGIGNKVEHYTADEQKAIDLIREEMRILPDGSVELPLVWNRQDGEIPRIPNNLKMVYKRQLSQEASLSKKPAYLAAYNENFRELIRENYVRAATAEDLCGDWPNVNYIPMSLVVNQNKNPIKFRNVFDASAKYLDTSLNKNLLKGPDLLVELINPLLSMRKNKIAYTADIKSMFMRVKINLRDQQCQRVLWRENPSEEFRIFIVSSMMFGPTPSPFSSQYVKNDTAERWMNVYPKASQTIIHDMYMDDICSSEKSLEEAISTANQCIEIFASINWHLVAFQSNSVDFLKGLPDSNVKQGTIPLLENENDSCVTKVLGCEWDTKSDSFVFKFDKNLFIKIVTERKHKPTKRDQCSTLARIFDILGFISHFTIRGKILLQRSWVKGLKWDEQISDEACKEWLEWLSDAEKVASVKIPRQFNPLVNLESCDKVELHTFSDAGTEAFGAVCYLVTVVKGTRYSNIVMAKAKVTPLRHKSRTQISELPRLELCACLIASRLANKITKQLHGIKHERYFWCDSLICLRWITNPNHKLLKYAISPVEEILDKTSRNEWRKVESKVNVADLVTKFRKFDFGDSKSTWFVGPIFLRLSEEHWPITPDLVEPPLAPETLQISSVNVNQVLYTSRHKLPPNNCPIMADYLIDSFSPSIKSSWNKLVRATARALKLWMDGLIPLLKSKKWNDKKFRNEIKAFHSNFECLTLSDLERAELFLIRKAQKESFPEEYERMVKRLPIDNQEFKELRCFLDTEGVIRIHSRVDLDECMYPQKFAPLLPRKNALTRILLLDIHYQYKHICVESQIAAIRSKYWIPQLRAAVKSVQHNCNFCAFQRTRPYAPPMAPLPLDRVDPLHMPFETTGLDCLGPIMTVNYTKLKKVWVLLFVCTQTRFVHLHLLDSLESIKVLEAISLFVNCFGPCRKFISDRGSNFIGASRVIEEDRMKTIKFLSEQHKVLSQELIDKYKVEWQLLPAHSPWMGGFYERLVKEVKRAIAHVLDKPKLDKVTLNIALQDAAFRINNRPLTHNPVSSHDDPILTPHMLVKHKAGWPLLPGIADKGVPNILYDRSIYRRGRALADEIMKRFVHNYLPILTKRTKWFRDPKPIRVGDLVLVIEPNDTRSEWKRARVIKLHKGRDGKTRVADIIMPNGSIKKSRSIQRLAKIEIKTLQDI